MQAASSVRANIDSRGCLVHKDQVRWQHDMAVMALKRVCDECSKGVVLKVLHLKRPVVAIWQLHMEGPSLSKI